MLTNEENVIWTYNKETKEIGRYENEGLAPKHSFPSIATRSSHKVNFASNDIDDVQFEHQESLTTYKAIAKLLQALSTLAAQSMPLAVHMFTPNANFQLTEPYCIEVHKDTFATLFSLLQHFKAEFEKKIIGSRSPYDFFWDKQSCGLPMIFILFCKILEDSGEDFTIFSIAI